MKKQNENYTFTVTKMFAVKAGVLFTMLTASASIHAWSGQKGSISLRPGGKMQMFDGWVIGRTLETRPPSYIRFSWKPSDWRGETESAVTYTITPAAKGAKLVIGHSGFPDRQQMLSHKSGWSEYVIFPLTRFITQAIKKEKIQ